MSKYIMLDVDGVLNCDSTNATAPSGAMGVSDNKIKLLKKIIDVTNAKVVLSSTWRYDRPCGKDYQYLVNKLKDNDIAVYSHIPDISSVRRGLETSVWLARHPDVEGWVVIDDIKFPDFDRGEFDGHLVITNYKYGLTEDDVEKAIRILNDEE